MAQKDATALKDIFHPNAMFVHMGGYWGTEQELTTTLAPDIELMAEANGITPEQMHQRLKEHYDGYHFADVSPDIYNPYSLIKAFDSKRTGAYWFDSGTPSFLIRQMQHFRTDITDMERLEQPASAFDKPTEAMTTALPLLYQSGYITIKGYDREYQEYTLSIPNQEVRIGYTEGLLPAYIGMNGGDVQSGFAVKFWKALLLRLSHLFLHFQEIIDFAFIQNALQTCQICLFHQWNPSFYRLHESFSVILHR